MEPETKRRGPKPKPENKKKIGQQAYTTPENWVKIHRAAQKANMTTSEFLIFKALQ